MTASHPTGNGPPDWEPTTLWNALAERPRPSAVIELPIKSYRGEQLERVRIQVLRRDEQTTVRVKALKRTVDRMRVEFRDFTEDRVSGNIVAEELLQNFSALETLSLALVSVDGVTKSEFRPEDGRDATLYKRLFRNADDVSRMVGDDELSVLWTQYLSVQRERGPLKDTMTAEEVDAWLALLQQGGDALPLRRLTLPALEKLTLALALRVANQSGSSPDSSPSGESPNGLASPGEKSPTGTSSFGSQPGAAGSANSTRDDVPPGADPEDAAAIVRELALGDQ